MVKCSKKNSFNRILGAENTLLNLEKRKELKKIKNREANIIKNMKNLFRLKKDIDDNTIKIAKNLFRLRKENEEIKNRTIMDIGRLLSRKKKIIINQ